MAINYENGEKNIDELLNWYKENEQNRNEAQTRFHIIDRLFKDCLGWETENIDVETRTKNGSQFSDYKFSLPNGLLIVEAKRESATFSLPENTERIRTIESLIKSNEELKSAIEQVVGYCNEQGVPIAGVANGTQLVIFIATRTDGIPPLEGKAIVFSSLNDVFENFIDIWNILSQKCISVEKIYKKLQEKPLNDLPEKLSKKILSYPNSIKRKTDQQNSLKVDADIIFEQLMEKGDIEDQFLENCYVKTDDLSNYALQGKEILEHRYSELSKLGVGHSLITSLFKSSSQENKKKFLSSVLITEKPILLVGDMNSGKTTFIRNFIKIEADDVLEKFINIYIDLQNQATLEESIKDFVPKEIVRQLLENYKININGRNFVRGIYRNDLKEFENSIYSDLKKFSKDSYEEHEIEFLDKKINEDRNIHLQKSLTQITKQYKKQIVVFLDNADQRNEEDQRSTFLIAQELALHQNLALFVSLRPEILASLTDHGILESSKYHSNVFTIRPPAIENVVKKRLNFALKITTGKISLPSLKDKDVHIDFKSLTDLINCFLDTLNANRKFPEIIENLSNGDVKIGLTLVKNFFGNPHIKQDKLINSDSLKKRINPIFFDEFLKSIILEELNYYDPDNKCVANLFDVSNFDVKEHFIIPSLLGYLDQEKKKNLDGFIEIKDIYEDLQATGLVPTQVSNAINACTLNGLIERKLRKISTSSTPAELRITERGIYHLKIMSSNFEYLEAMIVDTPILEETTRLSITEGRNIGDRLDRTEKFCDYLDEQWEKVKTPYFDWPSNSIIVREKLNEIRERIGTN